jgi:hypothetical protein
MGNPLVQDVITMARRFLRDSGTTGNKFTSESLLAYLQTGIASLYKDRPHAFYLTAVITAPPALVGLDDEIPVFPQYVVPLAYFVSGTALQELANDEYNARISKTHLDLYAALSA